MSLFKHTYSGLITGGLGLPACCGMITMGFHLFKCVIEVIQPPDPPTPGGNTSGGGAVTIRPGTRSRADDDEVTKKKIRITVKFRDSKRWIREYEVDEQKATIVIRAMNFINSVSKRLTVGVERVKNAAKHVTAVFTSGDK